MKPQSNSHDGDRPPQNPRFSHERTLLRRMFVRYAQGTLTEFFRERCINEGQTPQLLTDTLDEAVKQFPSWITQVALICHLTSHYRSSVHGYLASLLNDRQAADDLTQDTFINAMIAIRKGRPVPAPPKTTAWLLTIGTNLVRDAIRKRKARRECPLYEVDQTTLVAQDHCVDGKLDLREALGKLQESCGPMSVEIARLIQAGCNKEEIAARQNVSERTVERRLRSLATALTRFAKAA